MLQGTIMIFSTKPLLSAAAIAVAAGLFSTGSAAAQATRTWVSGAGNDANPCTRDAPCLTFGSAMSKTAAGGEVNCLDAGGFGPLFINKSISIVCDGAEAGILAIDSAGGQIVTAPTDTVLISGLDIESDGSGANGLFIYSAGTVTVRNSMVRGFGTGINIQPNQSGPISVLLDNVTVLENGNATPTSGGVLARPADNQAVTLTINHSRIANNRNVGFRFDTAAVSGTRLVATLNDSQVINNNVGILVKATNFNVPTTLTVLDSLVSRNLTNGILVNGIAATTKLGNTTVSDSSTGIAASNGAVLSSFGDNRLTGNATNGAFTMPLLPKN